ncbi:MAG: AAA family ATPase [Burkholderiaceae bacterium]|nr:AAA family ATPase [Burkholderiaceae bacterium]
MWSSFLDTLRQQFENQVFAGGIALGLVGVLAASLRHVPGLLGSQLQRALVVTATLDSRNDLFPAFVGWLNDQHFGQKSRWFTVVKAAPEVAESDAADGDAGSPPALQYSPAPGFHLFVYRGRLIEDVDAFFVAREKQDTRIEVSFSGLLNALDGVAAQEGRIVVLTTNHHERLDAALIRPGRIDLAVELGLATAGQLQGLFLRFFAPAQAVAAALAADYPGAVLSPAQIQQVLLGAETAEAAALALRAAWGAQPDARRAGSRQGAGRGTACRTDRGVSRAAGRRRWAS